MARPALPAIRRVLPPDSMVLPLGEPTTAAAPTVIVPLAVAGLGQHPVHQVGGRVRRPARPAGRAQPALAVFGPLGGRDDTVAIPDEGYADHIANWVATRPDAVQPF